MNVHQITLSGYTASAGTDANCVSGLYLGTAGSYGVEQLDVVQSAGWENLSVTAIFQPCGVKITVPAEGGTIDVPWEATADALPYPQGRVVFQGYADGELINTCDIVYTVSGHSATAGTDPQPPTPDQYQQFVKEVQASAEAAANSATEAAGSASAAASSASAAAGSAQQAADTLQQVQEAGQQATEAIGTAQSDAIKAVGDAQSAAVQAVQGQQQTSVGAVQAAGTAAVDQVSQAGQQQVQAVKDEGTAQIGAVAEAGSAQVQAVQQAGSQQITDIGEAGAQQVQAVNSAGDTKLDEINTAIAHPPQPNTSTGFWQVWNAETGQYEDTTALYQGGYYTPSVAEDGTLTWTGSQPRMPELPSANIRGPQGLGVPTPSADAAGQVPTVNTAGDGYLLTGPYAPLDASIRPTVSGNPAVCEDSVAWNFQGLKVYGKSTQDGTPSPETPVPIVSAGEGGSITLSITDGAEQIQSLLLSTPSGLPGIPVTSGGNYIDASGQQRVCDVVDFKNKTKIKYCALFKKESGTPLNFVETNLKNVKRYWINCDSKGTSNGIICDKLPYSYSANDEPHTYINGIVLAIFLPNDVDPTEFSCDILYPLETPIVTPLSDEEVAAYRALTTYPGTTVVSTAEPVAGIEARYIMDGTAAYTKITGALAQLSAANTQTSQVINTMLGASE